MDLYPTSDQDEIITSAADYLARELPADRMPKQTSTAPTPAEWRGLADMGWFGLGLPEALGGLGLSVVEEALVLRELGRQLAPPAALATILAGHLAAVAGDAGLVEALITGRRRACLATLSTEAEADATGPWTLVDSDGADLIVAWTPSAGLLLDREALADVAPLNPLDASLQVCSAQKIDAGRALARDESAGFQQRARVLTAAMLVGGLEATRDLSTEYAKIRQQFGQPIGAFQAIAHKCADMAVDSEAAQAILFYAAVCVRDGSPEAELYSASAKMVAARGAIEAAEASMLIHGGYGQTYEYLPHFYLKRARIYGSFGGGASADRKPVMEAVSTL